MQKKAMAGEICDSQECGCPEEKSLLFLQVQLGENKPLWVAFLPGPPNSGCCLAAFVRYEEEWRHSEKAPGKSLLQKVCQASIGAAELLGAPRWGSIGPLQVPYLIPGRPARDEKNCLLLAVLKLALCFHQQ